MGTPKSSILMGFSIINLGNHQFCLLFKTAFPSTTPPPLLERSLTESTQALPKNDNFLKLNIAPCQKAFNPKRKGQNVWKKPINFQGGYVRRVGPCASTKLACLWRNAVYEMYPEIPIATPWKIFTWNMSSWRFGRSCSFLNGSFVGSMLLFQGVTQTMPKKHDNRWWFRNPARKPPGMVLTPCK